MTAVEPRLAEPRSPLRSEPSRRPYLALIGALAVATFLQWIGSSAVLPLLPLFLRRQGSSDGMVGAVMAAFFAAGVAAQLVAGRVGDRIGHRTVLLFGLVGYAVASAGFLLGLGGIGYVVLRAGQGASAGAAQVAMLALVTRAVPAHVRGRAVSAVYGSELAGIAIGPMLGSWFGVGRMGQLFVIASAASLLAGIPVLLSRLLTAQPAGPASSPAVRLPRAGRPARVLAGVVIAAVVGGLLTGVYESCWTLLLDGRGATQWQVGLSWTLFAIPYVLVAPLAGWAADHHDRRWIVVAAMLVSIGFAVGYPWVGDVRWLVGLGAVESIGVAFAYPAAQSLLAEAAPAGAIGRAQGLFASVQTAAIAVSALASGGLFSAGPWVPFTVGGGISLALTASLPWIWRGLPGRVRRERG